MSELVLDMDRSVSLDSPLELTILMPCLNEQETIEVCVQKALAFLARANIQGEVLIADNGSTDGSQALAEAAGARVIAVKDRGYGAALKGGIAGARGKYIIMGDADDSYDFSRLDEFVAALRSGHDLVMGNRFKGGIAAGAMPPLHRYLGNPVLSWIGRLFFSIPVGDFHCGLRGFNTEAIRKLGLVTSGMEFASEMVVRSSLERLSIAEVPTTLKPDGRTRAPHLKTWRDGWRHLKFLLMYSPRWLFFIPGGLLLALGAALALALAFGSLQISSGVVLGMNSFVGACFAMIAGVQIISFGVLARTYASVTGMLPRGPRSDFIWRVFTTDTVVRIAAILLVVGLGVFGLAMARWASLDFGDITDPMTPRAVISGLTLIAIAIQLGFQAFMIGVLQIPIAPKKS